MQLSSSAESVDAGDDVTIDVVTSAGSYVGARAIDQSVLLLKSGNDITTERVSVFQLEKLRRVFDFVVP